jgi:hypothetical protein
MMNTCSCTSYSSSTTILPYDDNGTRHSTFAVAAQQAQRQARFQDSGAANSFNITSTWTTVSNEDRREILRSRIEAALRILDEEDLSYLNDDNTRRTHETSN